MALLPSRTLVAALAAFCCLTPLLAGCAPDPVTPPANTSAPPGAPPGAPTDVPETWPYAADPTSKYGLPKPVGLTPELKPETRILSTAEAAGLKAVEILNGGQCLHRTAVLPKCQFRITLATLPSGVVVGTVLASGVSKAAPAGLLVRVDSIDGNVISATEAGLGDALKQGEFRVERAFTAQDVTASELTPGVTHLPGATATKGMSKGLSAGAPEKLFGEGMGFHYGVDVTPIPGVRIQGEAHFDAGCGVDGGLTYWYGIPDGAWFDASCGLDQAAKLDVTVSTAAAASGQSYQLAKEVLGVIYFQVGPLPVIIVPELVVFVRIDGSLSANVSFGAEESVIAKVGVGYHGKFHPYAKFDATSDSHSQLPTDAVAARVGGEVAIRMMLYGILGPEMRGIADVKFVGGPDQSPKVCYSIRAAVGASIVLDFIIKSWDWGPYLFIDKTFGQGCRVNAPPVVTITEPTEGQTISLGALLVPKLTATAKDPEDGTLKVTWMSDVDGNLGTASGSLTPAFKTTGPHTLTARATDDEGSTGTAEVHITVVKPTWALSTAVTDLGGDPVTLSGGVLVGRQGEAYFVRATPSATANAAQPSCSAVSWQSSVPLQDKGNCLARISLDTQGTFTVEAVLTNPYGEPVTSTVSVTVGPPPTTVTPVFEGITVMSKAAGVLTNGQAFVGGDQLTLTVRYLNADQAGTPVTYAWSVRMDSGAWADLPTRLRSSPNVSTRQFTYSGVKTNHTFTFRCVVSSGGGALTTRTVTLHFLASPA